MRLTYINHSSFAIEADGFAMLFDYYRDTDKQPLHGFVHDYLLHRAGMLYVFSSHFHPDHFNKEILSWREQKEDICYLFSKDILKHRRAKADDARFLKKGEVYQDENLWVKACGSTDVGVSFLLQIKGLYIFHAGDLNNWHWKDESTPQEVASAEGSYLGELRDIVHIVDHLDVAMFPVDPRIGTDYMRGAEQFVSHIHTKMFVPMHFWSRPAEAACFAPYAESKGCRFVLLANPGEGIEIEEYIHK